MGYNIGVKSIFKNILVGILGWQVRRLRKAYDFKIVGVAGSIGKTSTKLAIAKILESDKKVRYQEGNYNDIVSVPLVFFGHKMPSLWNIFEWLKIIFLNEFQIWFSFPFDIVVVELGTDGPGQISRFRKYLHLDAAVLTAIAPEHMEFFENLGNVADEEWSVNFFSDKIFANKDLCKIVPENVDHKKIVFYGKEFSAYKIENILKTKEGFSFDISYNGKRLIKTSANIFSEIQIYSYCAAVALANYFKIPEEKIVKAISGVKSFPGRMQKLKGIKGSTIIDDTYNASPDAVTMALETLRKYEASQKIAILGMMNELGKISESEHKKIGELCDPKFLNLVVTIGKDANLFLAPAAKKNGCEVYEAKNSVDAGHFVKSKIKKGAVILAKGSQNGVFAEEAVKIFVADKSDFSKLVRQDAEWMRKKKYLYISI